MATYATEPVLLGSQIKMAVNFAYQGTSTTLDDLDYAKLTYFSPISKTEGVVLMKSDLIRRETTVGQKTTVEWFAIVDTSLVGKGQMKLRVEAEIPDDDVPETGVRTEIDECLTNVVIV
ncbi:MAG: hypothetical protein J5658_03755 [Prevotella sp.]|nr:hypothetical protein [Prevotella sp.]